MAEELWCDRVQREAGEKLAALLALPIDADDSLSDDERFDPWKLFPALYGSYSSAFDDLALAVLSDLRDRTFERSDLAAEMFREMLCTAELCSYGTSPRVCFPTTEFAKLLPDLIEKWRTYSTVAWGDETESR